MAAISECSKASKDFEVWLNQQERAKHNFPLDSILIMPVQRIPRYSMLLESLIKYTPTDHLDYQDLVEGLKVVRDAATYGNVAFPFSINSN
jgi:hypothetical protein